MKSNRRPMVMRSLVGGLASVVFCSVLQAATIIVPDDEATIQDAIDAAVSGDTIVVAAGVYSENLTLNKSLTLLGPQAGVDACERDDDESDEAVVTSIGGTLLRLLAVSRLNY